MDLAASDSDGSMDLQHNLKLLKLQQEAMLRSLQCMAENGNRFLEEVRELFASLPGGAATVLSTTSIVCSASEIDGATTYSDIGSSPTTIRSTINQHEHDLLRQNHEDLTRLHYYSHLLQQDDSGITEAGSIHAVMGSDLQVISANSEKESGVSIDVMWETATNATVVEGERDGYSAAVADNVDWNLKGDGKRIDEEPIDLWWVINASMGGGEIGSSHTLEAKVWSPEYLLIVGKWNESEITVDQIPLDGAGARDKNSRSFSCPFVDRKLQSESWGKSLYPLPLAEIHSPLEVNNGKIKAHRGSPTKFDHGLSEETLKKGWDMFILTAKEGACINIPECLHRPYFMVDIMYRNSKITSQDFIFQSLGFNDGIIVDILLGEYSKNGELNDGGMEVDHAPLDNESTMIKNERSFSIILLI